MTDDITILGLPDLDQDMAYAGHLINDGARAPSTEDELERYMEETQQLANAQFLPLEYLHVVTIATRDIQKDEEIFVTYGPVYWMAHTETWQGQDYRETLKDNDESLFNTPRKQQ